MVLCFVVLSVLGMIESGIREENSGSIFVTCTGFTLVKICRVTRLEGEMHCDSVSKSHAGRSDVSLDPETVWTSET